MTSKVGERRKFLVEVFVGNTRRFEETVWAESREDAESQVDRKYSQAGTIDITSIEEVEQVEEGVRMPQTAIESPRKARSRLLSFVWAFQETTLDEIGEFVDGKGLWFGPGVDFIDVLLANRDLGKLEIDIDAGLVRAR